MGKCLFCGKETDLEFKIPVESRDEFNKFIYLIRYACHECRTHPNRINDAKATDVVLSYYKGEISC